MNNRKERTKQELEKHREEIKNNTIKVPSGRADGATSHGSVCAAGFGASGMGRAQQRANYFYEEKKAVKRKEEIDRVQVKKNIITPKQKELAEKLGCKLPPNCSKKQAIQILSSAIDREKKKTKVKRRGKRF